MLKVVVLLASSAVCFARAGFDFPSDRYDQPQRPDQYSRPPGGFGGRPPGGGFGGRPRPEYGNRPSNEYGNHPSNYDTFTYEGGSNKQSSRALEVLYSWKQVDFVFPNNQVRENMIRDRRFIPKNNLILDVDAYGDKVFVTLPRVRPGVPVTLATVSSERRRGANLLAPFPDWRSNMQDCENGITSVFRTHIDPCGRMWVLDSGNNDAFNGNGSIVCPPQVLIYDLRNNNRLIGKYRIPSSMISDNTLLVTIAVDTRRSDCSDAYAYIADSIAYKMIVFNHRTGEFWRINSILFFPYPDQSRFTVNGVSFDLMGGIFGLALGPVYRGNRRLYFHCIDSVKQSWVDTANIRNQSMWRNNMNAAPRVFNLFNGSRSSQSAAAAMDNEGIMFFGLIASNEIACWNSETKFTRSNLISLVKDDTTLQFNSGIKVYRNKLYAATSRLQNYLNNRIDENDENYRILVGDLRRLTQGTKCEVDPLGNRIDTDYTPDSESVDYPENNEFSFPQ